MSTKRMRWHIKRTRMRTTRMPSKRTRFFVAFLSTRTVAKLSESVGAYFERCDVQISSLTVEQLLHQLLN
ncbi:MAG: hypothetical protein MJE68_09310 [Proteobacteria bacterium]|nr:hypothetical protein [Pseudomonadota bacterium]